MSKTYQLDTPAPIVILARSSTGDSYNVEFTYVNGRIRVFCNCKAGVTRQMCKHKLCFIKGSRELLYDESQAGCLEAITRLPGYDSLLNRLAIYEASISAIASKKRAVDIEEKRAKEIFASEIDAGFETTDASWTWNIPSTLIPKGATLTDTTVLDFRPFDVIHKKDGKESLQLKEVVKVTAMQIQYVTYNVEDGKYTETGSFNTTAEALTQKLKGVI